MYVIYVCNVVYLCVYVCGPYGRQTYELGTYEDISSFASNICINNDVYFVTEVIKVINNKCVSSLYAPRFVSGR